MTPILAHFGHWYIQAIFAVPVILLAGALVIDNIRRRRRQAGSARDRAGRGSRGRGPR